MHIYIYINAGHRADGVRILSYKSRRARVDRHTDEKIAAAVAAGDGGGPPTFPGASATIK